MLGGRTLYGPGYTLVVPPGFSLVNSVPAMGIYWLLPPGSTPIGTPAIVQLRSVSPSDLPILLQNLHSFENPFVAQANAVNLGLVSVLGTAPCRQVQLAQGLAYIREFDAITINGFPVRVMVVVIQGIQSAVEIVVVMNLYRWIEFAGACLALIGNVNLGTAHAPQHLQAVVDPSHGEQIEYHLIGPGNRSIPLTALPTSVGGTTIVNMGTIISTGNINGTGIAVGTHSAASIGAT